MVFRRAALVLVIYLSVQLLKFFGKLSAIFRSSEGPKSVCFSAEGIGNLGSRALTISTIKNLPSGTLFIGTKDFESLASSENLAPKDFLILPAIYPNFSLAHWRNLLRLAYATSGAEIVHIVGADMLDGYYSDSLSGLHWMVALGLESKAREIRILGSSWNAKASKLARSLCQRVRGKNIRVMARDSFSFERLKSILGAETQLTGDIVFAAFAHKIGDPSTSQVAPKPKILIAGNPAGRGNSQVLDIRPFKSLFDAFEKTHTFELIPSVIRENQNDLVAFEKIQKAASRAAQVQVLSHIPAPEEFVRKAAAASMLITFRMHPAILAAIAGTPVLMLDYQDKMSGLALDLGIPGSCLPEDFDLQYLPIKVQESLQSVREMRAVLRATVPIMVKKALQNFE